VTHLHLVKEISRIEIGAIVERESNITSLHTLVNPCPSIENTSHFRAWDRICVLASRLLVLYAVSVRKTSRGGHIIVPHRSQTHSLSDNQGQNSTPAIFHTICLIRQLIRALESIGRRRTDPSEEQQYPEAHMPTPGPHLPSILSSSCRFRKLSASLGGLGCGRGAAGPCRASPWRIFRSARNLLPPRSLGMCWPCWSPWAAASPSEAATRAVDSLILN